MILTELIEAIDTREDFPAGLGTDIPKSGVVFLWNMGDDKGEIRDAAVEALSTHGNITVVMDGFKYEADKAIEFEPEDPAEPEEIVVKKKSASETIGPSDEFQTLLDAIDVSGPLLIPETTKEKEG